MPECQYCHMLCSKGSGISKHEAQCPQNLTQQVVPLIWHTLPSALWQGPVSPFAAVCAAVIAGCAQVQVQEKVECQYCHMLCGKGSRILTHEAVCEQNPECQELRLALMPLLVHMTGTHLHACMCVCVCARARVFGGGWLGGREREA